MTLTVISLGFGARSGTAGVVTMGFGTAGPAPTTTTQNPGGGYSRNEDRLIEDEMLIEAIEKFLAGGEWRKKITLH